VTKAVDGRRPAGDVKASAGSAMKAFAIPASRGLHSPTSWLAEHGGWMEGAWLTCIVA
jgi:hypothetical protein